MVLALVKIMSARSELAHMQTAKLQSGVTYNIGRYCLNFN